MAQGFFNLKAYFGHQNLLNANTAAHKNRMNISWECNPLSTDFCLLQRKNWDKKKIKKNPEISLYVEGSVCYKSKHRFSVIDK